MKMKHSFVSFAVLLIVAAALMFLIPFVRNAVWWIAAGCTMLMFGLCAFAFVRAFRRDETLESKVLGWPIFKVGYVSLIVQMIVGAVIMGIASFCPVWAAVIAELIVFAAAGICLTVKDAARDVVVTSETAARDKTAAWKAIRSRADAIAAQTGHPELKKLAEEIRYADPTPTELDGQIAQMLEILSSYADSANIKKMHHLIEQRKAVSKKKQ